MIYRNNDKRSVNIDMVLLTVQGDLQPITRRKKLQTVPVPYTDFSMPGGGYEPCEVRAKTDFYYHELIGVFNDHFNYVRTVYDGWLASGETGVLIRDFLYFLELPDSHTAEEKKEKKEKAAALLERIKKIAYIPANVKDLIEAVKKTLSDYLDDTTPEPAISQKDLFALQESIESFTVYNDHHKTLSTLELTVGGQPFYPAGYPVANIVPRYRKSFNETMYRTSMSVHEADIFIRFAYRAAKNDRPHVPTDFIMYFLYHQNVKR
jgi:hypothetical protein